MMRESVLQGVATERVKAVAQMLREFDGEYAIELEEYFREAERALELADEADRAAGIMRVEVKHRQPWWKLTHKGAA